MRKAYATRSQIVHRGELDADKLKDINGTAATPEQVADDLEDIIRTALKKAEAPGVIVGDCGTLTRSGLAAGAGFLRWLRGVGGALGDAHRFRP